VTNGDTALAKVTEATRALALATSLPQINELRATGRTLLAWAKSHGAGEEAMRTAGEFVIRVEHAIGKELRRMLESGERVSPKDTLRNSPSAHDGTTVPTLEQIGIKKMAAARWQQLAKLTDEELESALSHLRETDADVTRAALYRLYDALHPKEPRPVEPQAENFAEPTAQDTLLKMLEDLLLDRFLEITDEQWMSISPSMRADAAELFKSVATRMVQVHALWKGAKG
jgi:hypothetical protein